MPAALSTLRSTSMVLKTLDSWQRCSATNCPCPNHAMAIPSPTAPDTFNEDPTFYHLSHTNNPPLPSEDCTLRLLIDTLQLKREPICASMSELESLRAEICSQIDERILALKQEEKKVLASIARRKAILSPARRLPPEILSQVFLHSIDFPNYTVSNGDWPWTIERVCKAWRAIILAYPRFWSFLNVHTTRTYRSDPPSKINPSIPQLKAQLFRSREWPLSLLLSDRGPIPPELIEVLAQCASRVQDLHINIGDNTARGLVFLKDCFETLSSLHVIPNAPPQVTIPLLDLGRCPNLRYVETYAVSRPKLRFIIHWPQIQHYFSFLGKSDSREGRTSCESLLALLTGAPQLREVFFSLQDRDSWRRTTPPPVPCSHLQSLSLEHGKTVGLPSFRQFFECITFPCLTNLEICIHEGASTDPMGADVFSAMVDAIVRSSCPLLHLSYTQGSVLSDDIIRLIHAVRTLMSMKLRNVASPGITDALFHELKDHDLVPHLHTLILHGCLQFNGEVYLDMFQMRCANACPLKCLELSLVPSTVVPWDDAEAQLETIREGLKEYSSLLTFTGRVI